MVGFLRQTPPIPQPLTNVDDLIGFARTGFVNQEKSIAANVRAAQTAVFEMRKTIVYDQRAELFEKTDQRIFSSATICLRNAVDHRPPLDLTASQEELQ